MSNLPGSYRISRNAVQGLASVVIRINVGRLSPFFEYSSSLSGLVFRLFYSYGRLAFPVERRAGFL